jgi:2-polyprenyl-6-methoxyphenol hydroxylase-like FAD-dependent oxidoreductase
VRTSLGYRRLVVRASTLLTPGAASCRAVRLAMRGPANVQARARARRLSERSAGGAVREEACDFVAACDGAHSALRRQLGLASRGERARHGGLLLHPLLVARAGPAPGRAARRRDAELRLQPGRGGRGRVARPAPRRLGRARVLLPTRRVGRALRGRSRRRCAPWPRCALEGEPQGTSWSSGGAGAVPPLRDLALRSVKAWGMYGVCAERLSSACGRVLLAGDATHQFPPSGS